MKHKKVDRRRRSDGDATKAHIEAVARRQFITHGKAETTSKKLCALAKTNIAAINYHFGSKDELVEHLFPDGLPEYADVRGQRDALGELMALLIDGEVRVEAFHIELPEEGIKYVVMYKGNAYEVKELNANPHRISGETALNIMMLIDSVNNLNIGYGKTQKGKRHV